MTAEDSPHCGQTGRVCRVFWRADAPWVLLRAANGALFSLPWAATDLPKPVVEHDPPAEAPPAVLLAPAALLALARFLRHRAGEAAVATAAARRAR